MRIKNLRRVLPGIMLALLSHLAHAEGVLAVDNPAKNAMGAGGYATIEAFEGNDQIALKQYGGDWQGEYSPRDGRNIGLLAARAEAGVQWRGFRLGWLYRGEALVEASRDASDLVYAYKNKSGYDVGRTYLADYRISGFEADGARLSKRFSSGIGEHWRLDLGVGLSYLRGKRLKMQTVSGQVVGVTAKDLNGMAGISDMDTRMDTANLDKFNAPFGKQATPLGEGYALDAGLVVTHEASGARLELAVNDLAGKLKWRDLPGNIMSAGTAETKYYDADGWVHFNPQVTRQSRYFDLTQNLDSKTWLALAYPLGGFEVQAATSHIRGYWFPQASLAYHVSPTWKLMAEYDFRFNTVGLLIRHPWVFFGLRTENIDFDKARAYGVNGGINISF